MSMTGALAIVLFLGKCIYDFVLSAWSVIKKRLFSQGWPRLFIKADIDMQTLEFTNRLFLLYREFLEGKSYYAIGQGLTADGIRTAAGNNYWHCSTLKNILMNEKYIGDALLQKTVTTDFLTKKRVVNNGIVPQYYVENSHGD